SRSIPGQVECSLGGLKAERHKGQRNKASSLQTALGFFVLHKTLPDALIAIVLDHDRDRPLINAQYIRGVPSESEVEGITKAVCSPDVESEARVKRAQGWQGVFRGKGQS